MNPTDALNIVIQLVSQANVKLSDAATALKAVETVQSIVKKYIDDQATSVEHTEK